MLGEKETGWRSLARPNFTLAFFIIYATYKVFTTYFSLSQLNGIDTLNELISKGEGLVHIFFRKIFENPIKPRGNYLRKVFKLVRSDGSERGCIKHARATMNLSNNKQKMLRCKETKMLSTSIKHAGIL